MTRPLIPQCRDAFRLLGEIIPQLETDERVVCLLLEAARQAIADIIADRYEAAR